MSESDHQLWKIIDAIPTLAWSARPDGSADFFNLRWLEYTGLSREQALDWGWKVAIHPDDLPHTLEIFHDALNFGRPFEVQGRLRRWDGEFRWFLIRGSPLLDGSGKVGRWYGTNTDLEDYKRAEYRLQVATSERTHLLAVRAEIAMALARKDTLRGILHHCTETIVRHLDAAFARVWTLESGGGELELEASTGMYDRLDGRYSRIPVGQFKIGLIAQERKPHLTNDVQNDPRISEHNWAKAEKMQSFAGYPLIVEDRVVGVMGMFSRQVLTEGTLETLAFIADGIAQGIERKRAEEEGERLRQAQRIVVETANDAVVSADESGAIQFANPATARIFGYDPKELIGRPLTVLMANSIRKRHENGFKRYLSTGQRHINWQSTELTGLRKNGEEFPVEVSFGELTMNGHQVFTGFIRDISERKRAEEERERLRQTQAELARVNRVSTMGELTASLAHEIKQPITSAVTNAQTCLRLLRRAQPEVADAEAAASRLVHDITRAAEIIGRIGSLFQKGVLQRELVDINELIREMIVLLRGEAATNSISIHSDLASSIPQVMADRVQLQQVLMNLMLNGIEAMKAMRSSGKLTITSRQSEDHQLLVSVVDTGVGLRPEQAGQIFKVFFTTKPQGTGVGLPISRSIIESHGGRLWTGALSGQGAVFHFTLPIESSLH